LLKDKVYRYIYESIILGISLYNGAEEMDLEIKIFSLGPIRDSELHLEPGSLTIVFGPTASGKSILLNTLSSIYFRSLGDVYKPFTKEILDQYMVKDFNIRVNGYVLNNKYQLLEINPLKNSEFTPIYFPANRITLYKLSFPAYEAFTSTLISLVKGKGIVNAIIDAYYTYSGRVIKEMYEDIDKLLKAVKEKTISYNTFVERVVEDIRKYLSTTYPFSSFLTFYNLVLYAFSTSLLDLSEDHRRYVYNVYKKYFGHTGNIEYKDNVLRYIHSSGFTHAVRESSDGIREIIYMILILALFKNRDKDHYKAYVAIDEVELHLYPRTLIGLLDYLLDHVKSYGSTVVVSSHSLFTVAWGIKHVLRKDPVKLLILSRRDDGFYELREHDLSMPLEGFEDLYMELLLSHRVEE